MGGWSVAILTQPIVSAEAFIKIGQVGTPVYDFGRERVVSELLENRSSLREIIYNKYRIHEARLKKLSLPYLVDVDKRNDPDIIKLVSYGRDDDEAIQYLWTVINWIIERHDRKMNLVEERFGEHIAVLDAMQKDIQALIRGSTVEDTWTSLSEMVQEFQVKADLASANNYRSQIEIPPRVLLTKIQPKPLLYIFTGLITGFALALVIIGLRKEWRAYHSRLR